jgi:hypothetical protein
VCDDGAAGEQPGVARPPRSRVSRDARSPRKPQKRRSARVPGISNGNAIIRQRTRRSMHGLVRPHAYLRRRAGFDARVRPYSSHSSRWRLTATRLMHPRFLRWECSARAPGSSR